MQLTTLLVVMACVTALFTSPVQAESAVLNSRLMTLETASKVAGMAVKSCADSGYQVSAVVVDRSGVVQVIMRDVYASRFTIEIAQRKANASILSGTRTSTFRKNRADIRAELNEIDGILVLDGAVPIRAAGTLLGAVGVSGAPGGDKDEACARVGVDSILEQLEFAD